MKRFLFAPLALGALLLSTAAATAAPAPRPPHHLSPREQAPGWEAQHRLAPAPHQPAPRPVPPPAPASHYHRGDPLPTHRVTRLPLRPAAPTHR